MVVLLRCCRTEGGYDSGVLVRKAFNMGYRIYGLVCITGGDVLRIGTSIFPVVSFRSVVRVSLFLSFSRHCHLSFSQFMPGNYFSIVKFRDGFSAGHRLAPFFSLWPFSVTVAAVARVRSDQPCDGFNCDGFIFIPPRRRWHLRTSCVPVPTSSFFRFQN